jgi:hypothetical protein
VSYPNEKVPYIIKPNESLPHIDGNWRTRTPEADTTIVKYGPTTTVKQGNTTTVFGSGSIHRLNTTEAAMKFTKNENNKSDMNGAIEKFAASVVTTDQHQGSEKSLYRNTNVSVTDFLTVTCLTNNLRMNLQTTNRSRRKVGQIWWKKNNNLKNMSCSITLRIMDIQILMLKCFIMKMKTQT